MKTKKFRQTEKQTDRPKHNHWSSSELEDVKLVSVGDYHHLDHSHLLMENLT
jgi:hypothetical protein